MKTELVTIKQLADYYKVSSRTIERWKEIGLPFIQVGTRSIRYDFNEVNDWVKQHN